VLLVAAVMFGLFGSIYSVTTLTVWAVDGQNPNDPQQAYAISLKKDFEAKNPDIKLDWTGFGTAGNALNQKLTTAMANDQGPDIFQSWGGSFMSQFADADKLLDLTPEVNAINFSTAAKAAMSYKGKTYGIAPFFGLAGMYVNDGIFKKLGLKTPTTIDELEAAAAKIKAAGIQPFACGEKDKWPLLQFYMYMVNRYGGDVFTDANNRKVRFDADAFVQSAQKIHEWAAKGYFGDKPLAEGYGDAQLLMQTGKAAMIVSGSWLASVFSDKTKTEQNISFYPFPVAKGGKGMVTDIMGMTDIGFVANKTAASKKDAVVRFMKYAMTVEALSKEPGRVATVAGVKAKNPITGQSSAVFVKGKFVQFWWDQNLPAAVSAPVNDMLQTFLIPETDVKAALAKYEALFTENIGPVK
jgi:ABC-type glycerol-3-phosphate transport system substrate-binding protein